MKHRMKFILSPIPSSPYPPLTHPAPVQPPPAMFYPQFLILSSHTILLFKNLFFFSFPSIFYTYTVQYSSH